MSTQTPEGRVYQDPERVREPHEVDDPRTTRVETALSIWERLTDSLGGTLGLLVVGVLGIAGFVILWQWTSRLLVTLLTNGYVQSGAAVGVALLSGIYLGSKRKEAQLEHQERLTLDHLEAGMPVPYRGEYEAVKGGHVFTPYKGVTGWLTSSWEPYSVAELMDDPAAPAAPAKIFLPKPAFKLTMTDTGLVGVIKVQCLEYHPGRGANLRAKLPADGAEDSVEAARRELEKQIAEHQDLVEQLDSERQRRMAANERAGKAYEDALEYVDQVVTTVEPLMRGSSQRRSEDDDAGSTATDLAAIEEELIHED